MEFFTYILPNGIKCIHKRIKSPVTYCAVTINAGTRDELAAEQGMAHFAEHTLFKGTTRRKAYHINNRLEKLGGELNAFTTKEETVVHATTLKSDFPKAIELISDIVFDSTFPEKEVEKEKEVILDEINSYKDSPAERIYDEFEDILFAGSALGHNILGSRSSVNKFRGTDIDKFTKRCYNTDQMVLSIGGDMTERKFMQVVTDNFGGRASSVRDFERVLSAPSDSFERTLRRGTHQAHCIIGSRAYDAHDPKRIILSLLINLLGGPAANSLLNTLLREKNGLTYSIEASYTPYCDTGIAAIYFGSDKDKLERCIELVTKELARIMNTALTTRQLSMAKKQYVGQLAIALENKEWYMLSAGKSYMLYNEVDSPQAIYKKIEAITASSIMDSANEIFEQTSSLIYNGGTR